jgi:hypothetical protein
MGIKASAQDVALLREIVSWRRRSGVDFAFGTATYRLPDGRTISWGTNAFLPDERPMEIGLRMPRDMIVWHQAATLTEMVDVAVAYGFLPERFSSAYRAGWNAGRAFMADEIEDIGIFPAVEATW